FVDVDVATLQRAGGGVVRINQDGERVRLSVAGVVAGFHGEDVAGIAVQPGVPAKADAVVTLRRLEEVHRSAHQADVCALVVPGKLAAGRVVHVEVELAVAAIHGNLAVTRFAGDGLRSRRWRRRRLHTGAGAVPDGVAGIADAAHGVTRI